MSIATETDGNLIIEYITRQMNGIVVWADIDRQTEMNWAEVLRPQNAARKQRNGTAIQHFKL